MKAADSQARNHLRSLRWDYDLGLYPINFRTTSGYTMAISMGFLWDFYGILIWLYYVILLWSFFSYKWLFLWDYTFYKWGYTGKGQ